MEDRSQTFGDRSKINIFTHMDTHITDGEQIIDLAVIISPGSLFSLSEFRVLENGLS